MNFLSAAASWLTIHWRISITTLALTAAGSLKYCFENDNARTQRLQRKEKKRLRELADRIWNYGRKIHRLYPSGDVIVSQHDLAGQLRQSPQAVITALNLLLKEQKVQKAPLKEYWKLNM